MPDKLGDGESDEVRLGAGVILGSDIFSLGTVRGPLGPNNPFQRRLKASPFVPVVRKPPKVLPEEP